MSLNILAILLSLAMMLTGVGGEGQPAEASKMMVLHDISITYNAETVDLTPALWLGAFSDGRKAVFDAAIQMDGDTLFPMQLGVDETGITALFEKSDVALKVSAEALNTLSEQAAQLVESVAADAAEGENAELMDVLMNEFIPAYTGLIEAVKDPDFSAEMQQTGEAIYAEIIDRGEGTPVTETIDGQDYALIEYSYTIDSDKLADLIDAIYTSNEKLNAYYEAMFKLYSVLPEETGLSGLTSYRDLFEKMKLDMSMDAVEKLSDDGEVDIMDAILTIDLSGMIESIAELEEDDGDEESEAMEIDPIVIDIASSKVGEVKDAVVTFEYEMEDVGMNMTMTGHTEGLENLFMQMEMQITEDDELEGGMNVVIDAKTDETGEKSYEVSYNFTADGVDLSMHADGTKDAEGAAQNNFSCAVNTEDVEVGLSFALDVMNGEIGDLANGHEAAAVIDDLSSEAWETLGQDQGLQAALMQIIGSMSADAQKLMADESVQALIGLVTATEDDDSDYDYDYDPENFDGEGDDYDDVEVYTEEVEDDGALAFDMPEVTWLPEGWSVDSTDTDTAYDWVSMNIVDAEGMNRAYMMFYADSDDAEKYVVGEDGSLNLLEDREVSITDLGDDMLSITMSESGVFASITIDTATIDMDAVGKIIAGIRI